MTSPVFYILACVTLVSAICAMTLRSLIHCALCLAVSFLGFAALFLQMDAMFIAFAQVLVYIGAVAVLIVFAILLTRNAETSTEKRTQSLGAGLLVGAVLAGILILTIVQSPLPVSATKRAEPSVAQLGTALLTGYVVPLEFVGLLLTIALLGAVLLALPEKSTAIPVEAAE